eukprot:6174479-Pleurochrysis_carterae.AAC.2
MAPANTLETLWPPQEMLDGDETRNEDDHKGGDPCQPGTHPQRPTLLTVRWIAPRNGCCGSTSVDCINSLSHRQFAARIAPTDSPRCASRSALLILQAVPSFPRTEL